MEDQLSLVMGHKGLHNMAMVSRGQAMDSRHLLPLTKHQGLHNPAIPIKDLPNLLLDMMGCSKVSGTHVLCLKDL